MVEESEIKLCKRCGGKVVSRGYATFAHEPHKRKNYTCTECGHISTKTVSSKEEVEQDVA